MHDIGPTATNAGTHHLFVNVRLYPPVRSCLNKARPARRNRGGICFDCERERTGKRVRGTGRTTRRMQEWIGTCTLGGETTLRAEPITTDNGTCYGLILSTNRVAAYSRKRWPTLFPLPLLLPAPLALLPLLLNLELLNYGTSYRLPSASRDIHILKPRGSTRVATHAYDPRCRSRRCSLRTFSFYAYCFAIQAVHLTGIQRSWLAI